MPIDRIARLYRAALGGSTLLMVALSWPLWLDDPNFPRVPFLAGLPILPEWVAWLVLSGILATLALVTIGRGGHVALGASLVLLSFAVVQDQNRLQPWAYQFLVVGLPLASLSRERSLRLARFYTIGLYVYSGLSKLDVSFCRELGPTFLSAGLGLVGISGDGWSPTGRTLAVLAMPAFEVVVAGLLAFRTTRRWGLGGSILLHGALVLILGPWSLGHSTIVLVWNLAQVVENLVLFGPSKIPEVAAVEPDSRFTLPARILFWAAMIWPLGERFGLCDAWPGHALYASHAERSEVDLPEADLDRYPESIRRWLAPADFTPWRRLDLTAWSRDVRGTPLYPSGRVGNAVAEFLESRYGGVEPVRLIQWSRASIWAGQRERDESLGLRAIRKRAGRFFLNAHPSLIAPKGAKL